MTDHADARLQAQYEAFPYPQRDPRDEAKRLIVGIDDPQMSHADADQTAERIGAPAPLYVPGRHLTMISSPEQVAAAVQAFTGSA